MGETFWVWLVIVTTWSFFGFALLSQTKIDFFENLAAILFLILAICVLIGAIGATGELLKYHQVWPFQPQ